VQLPKGKGLWPAIYLRTTPKLPLEGEIGVVEGFGSHPNIVQSSLRHWVNGVPSHPTLSWLVVRPQPDSPRFHQEGVTRVDKLITLRQDLSEDFHVYALDWQPDHVTWTFDGLPYFTVKEHIPKDPMVIVLQLALDTTWDGKPDATTVLPQSLDVHYVRVWK
jgi:beta-glucanase (GH16 family)